ncbi:RipA family octameric membrane protein [Deferrisoma camini]|uniref:RipA family octameric membrane protein n=1 Tax=Deferrisoma camini TaxID=1035120 RepID=UPI000A06471C|nr:hypothetical protein [Deferrisoma camini]
MSLEETLFRVKKAEYGANYESHYIEQYKLYVEMADRISSRRQSANSFFLSVNTAVVALIGYVQLGGAVDTSNKFYWLVSIAGMALCYTWYRLIRSYKDLNSGKFKVIHVMEKNLPIAPYDAEWESLERGKNPKIYHPFTRVEMVVPWVFFALHLSVLVNVVPWSYCFHVLINK